MDKAKAEKRIGELEDTLKQRDRTILELRQEAEKAQALIAEMREHVEDADSLIDSWIEGFGMVLNDDGKWDIHPWVTACDEEHESYVALVHKWNALVAEHEVLAAEYLAVVAPRKRSLGRPLEASEAQQQDVLARREAGESFRAIVTATGLGIRTVRTIVGKANGTDRTSQKRSELRRLELNRARMASWRARKRTRDALPGRLNALIENGRELVRRSRRS